MYLTIKKGKHRSNWWLPKLTFKKTIIGKITFLGDHEYDIGKYQKDSNKIIGFSNGIWHRYNSIRIGFRWNKVLKCIDIVGICYDKGKREIRVINRISNNSEKIPFLISIEKDKYIVKVGDKVEMFNNTSKWKFIRYYLFPYFGGVSRAPKDFKFKLEIF
jgi:hypothetical protein